MRARKLITKIMLSLLLTGYAVSMGASVAYGQTPTPTPGTGHSVSFGEEIARMCIEAERWLPHLMYEVEGPLLPFFVKIAEIIGIALVMTAFLKLLRQHSGASFDLLWWFGRVAFFVAMISLTSAAIDFCEDMGNAIAYGNDRHASFLNEARLGAMESFNDSFDKFVAGTFTLRVNGADVPVNPNPDTENPAYALIGILYSKESKLEDVTSKLDISAWSMSSLFSFLSFCRGFLDFVDLLIILARPFILIGMRLAAPFMMALGLDRDFAKQSTYKYLWGLVVLTWAWPTVTQVMRFVAYSAGNLAIGDTQGLYIWNKATMTAIAQAGAKPEYRIILLGAVMFGSGVGVLFSHWIAYKFVMGQMFEGVANLVTQLQGAGLATGVGTFSAAGGQAVMKQAEQMQVQGQADATSANVEGRREAGNISAKGNEVAGIASARGSQVMSLGQIEGARQSGVMQAASAGQFGRESTAAGVGMQTREAGIARDQSNAMTGATNAREALQIAGEAKAAKKDKWTGSAGFGAVPIIGGPIGEGIVAGPTGFGGISSVTQRARTQNEAANSFAQNAVTIQNQATTRTVQSQQQYGQDMTGVYDKKQGADISAVNTQAGIAAGGVNRGTGIIIGGIQTKHGYDVRANQVEYNAGMKAMTISRDAGIEASKLKSEGALISQFGSIAANQINQMFREVRF
jgi:hypothetical protein